MATRRIARGRAGSPVPIIILSVLVVGLIASTVVLGLTVGDLEKKLVTSQDAVMQEKELSKKQLDDFRKYERLIGLTKEGADREFATLKEDLQKKASVRVLEGAAELPATFVDLKTLLDAYATRCAALEKEVARIEGEMKTAKDQREEAMRNGEESVKTKEKQIKVEQDAVVAVRTSLGKVEKERDEVRERLTGEVEDLKGRTKKLSLEVAAASKDVVVRDEKIKKLEEKIKDLERGERRDKPLHAGAIPEPVDGKVLTVDADGTYAMVDVGRKDWVEVGMFFTVFEKGSAEGRQQKGQIQIRQVFDEISRAKIIKQDELDPILPGMIVVNPAFKRGTKLEFRLLGRFTEPRVEQLLSRYPCTVVTKVSLTTDYVVIGGAKPDEAKGEVPWDEDEEVLYAKENKIPIMRERELLNYLGEQ